MKNALLSLTLVILTPFSSSALPLFLRLNPEPALPKLGADASSVTASGLSAGAFMAVQLGVAYSDQIRGVAPVAGGIYNCSLGQTDTATGLCMKTPEKIEVAKYLQATQESAQKNDIAPLKNLAQQKVLIIHGSEDKVVAPVAGQKLAEFYQALGANVATEFSMKMGHGFPSSLGKTACDKSMFPWINKCEVEGAEKILAHFYGPLSPPPAAAGRWLNARSGELVAFDQTAYGSKEAKMMDSGHVYIPKECKTTESKCRVHIALHGCLQSPAIVKQAFTEDAGYNRWADTNRIIVLYPATTSGAGNPTGCWDWFGYTNADFAVRKSLQMTAIMKMVATLTSPGQRKN